MSTISLEGFSTHRSASLIALTLISSCLDYACSVLFGAPHYIQQHDTALRYPVCLDVVSCCQTPYRAVSLSYAEFAASVTDSSQSLGRHCSLSSSIDVDTVDCDSTTCWSAASATRHNSVCHQCSH